MLRLVTFFSYMTLQIFTGVFHAISIKKGCRNHRETLYSSKGKIVYVIGKPFNIYRLQGNPIVIIGFFLQSVNIIGFPHNILNLSLWGVEAEVFYNVNYSVKNSTADCKYLLFLQDFFFGSKQYKKCQHSWLFFKKNHLETHKKIK